MGIRTRGALVTAALITGIVVVLLIVFTGDSSDGEPRALPASACPAANAVLRRANLPAPDEYWPDCPTRAEAEAQVKKSAVSAPRNRARTAGDPFGPGGGGAVTPVQVEETRNVCRDAEREGVANGVCLDWFGPQGLAEPDPSADTDPSTN
jgi:hypothetical protein